jgi:hypothetical protein
VIDDGSDSSNGASLVTIVVPLVAAAAVVVCVLALLRRRKTSEDSQSYDTSFDQTTVNPTYSPAASIDLPAKREDGYETPVTLNPSYTITAYAAPVMGSQARRSTGDTAAAVYAAQSGTLYEVPLDMTAGNSHSTFQSTNSPGEVYPTKRPIVAVDEYLYVTGSTADASYATISSASPFEDLHTNA